MAPREQGHDLQKGELVQEAPVETKSGSVRVALEVLATIAALSALEVPGVVRLEGGFTGQMGRLISAGRSQRGVKLTVDDNDEVWVELHIVARPEASMYRLGTEVQHDVARAISNMVGMQVHSVDVYIEDVE